MFGTQGTTLSPKEADAVISKIEDNFKGFIAKVRDCQLYRKDGYPVGQGLIAYTKPGVGKDFLDSLSDKVNGLKPQNALKVYLETAKRLYFKALKEVTEMDLDSYCEKQGIEIPTCISQREFLESQGVHAPVEPELGPVTTEEDLISQLSEKERCLLLSSNSKAAAIGTAIHPNGAFAKSREALLALGETKAEINTYGNSAVVVSETPSVSVEDVNNVFFALQNEHRELEASRNRLNEKIKRQLREAAVKRQEDYKVALEAYNKANEVYCRFCRDYDALVQKKDDRVKEIRNQMEKYRLEERERILSLRITIPDELLAVYNEVA